jgi:hypothetical protein
MVRLIERIYKRQKRERKAKDFFVKIEYALAEESVTGFLHHKSAIACKSKSVVPPPSQRTIPAEGENHYGG